MHIAAEADDGKQRPAYVINVKRQQHHNMWRHRSFYHVAHFIQLDKCLNWIQLIAVQHEKIRSFAWDWLALILEAKIWNVRSFSKKYEDRKLLSFTFCYQTGLRYEWSFDNDTCFKHHARQFLPADKKLFRQIVVCLKARAYVTEASRRTISDDWWRLSHFFSHRSGEINTNTDLLRKHRTTRNKCSSDSSFENVEFPLISLAFPVCEPTFRLSELITHQQLWNWRSRAPIRRCMRHARWEQRGRAPIAPL